MQVPGPGVQGGPDDDQREGADVARRRGTRLPGRTAAQSAWYSSAGIDGAEAALKAGLAKSSPLLGNKQSDQLSQLFTQYALQAVNGQTSGKETMSSIAGQLGTQ